MILIVLAVLMLSACRNNQSENEAQPEKNQNGAVAPEIVILPEAFATQRDTSNNVDSPAVWHGADGQHWLLATAKEGNVIIVYDAATGEKIKQFGQGGGEAGELRRPNGIAVIEDLAIVVERDNHRIQVFSLPDAKSLGVFGESVLRRPYGLTVDRYEDRFHLYVTDNYETASEEVPPADSLGRRVHHFTFTLENNRLEAEWIKAFGDTAGEGVLYTVESILIDREYGRLLISDEHEEHRDIKVYDTEGLFTGKTLAQQYFQYEPEGIVLWKCDADSSGYYLAVDQDITQNTFQVFDRKSLEYLGGFSGEITRNTDGIALTQRAFGDFKYGAFYPVHNDGSVTAISWETIAKNLDLKYNCQ